MSEAIVRKEIKAILKGVAGIGRVHGRPRLTKSLARWLAMMESDGVTNGWVINRVSSKPVVKTMPTIERIHSFRISGIYEIDDEKNTHDTFNTLVEAIFDAFKSNIQLNGTCLNSEPIDVVDVDDIELNDTLYHAAELTLTCTERVYYS